MRILHCCLAAFYIDGYGYQENVLPKMHKLQGHDVAILASTETYLDNSMLGYTEPRSYHTEDGIPIQRLSYAKGIPHRLAKKIRIYSGLDEALKSFGPDIIFLHDCQFLSIGRIAAYADKHPRVKIYVDGHTDFTNSARSWISRNILHRIVYRYCAKTIESYAEKFYGVLPVRVEFFQKMYGIPKEKTELLLLGADDTKFDLAQRDVIRASVRQSLDVRSDDFLIVTGGKIDRRKSIHVLMAAVRKMNNDNIKLIVFGTPNEEMKPEIDALAQHACIKSIGWIASEKAYDYFLASDLGVFPGTHSVLWEQAVGVGLPCVFRKWEGVQHVDIGGNCLFLSDASEEEIEEVILRIYRQRDMYLRMKKVAMGRGVAQFSYYQIAMKAIQSELSANQIDMKQRTSLRKTTTVQA
jgi:1,2-diacylglycerol 3-alpha-glucosyltransferase